MPSSATQVKFRLNDEELAQVERARGSLSIPEFCKRQVLSSIQQRPIPVAMSADARATVKPIPKGAK